MEEVDMHDWAFLFSTIRSTILFSHLSFVETFSLGYNSLYMKVENRSEEMTLKQNDCHYKMYAENIGGKNINSSKINIKLH